MVCRDDGLAFSLGLEFHQMSDQHGRSDTGIPPGASGSFLSVGKPRGKASASGSSLLENN